MGRWKDDPRGVCVSLTPPHMSGATGGSLFSLQPLLCSAADFGAGWSWRRADDGQTVTPSDAHRPAVALCSPSILSELSVHSASQAAVGKKFPQHLSADWWSGSSLAWPALQWSSPHTPASPSQLDDPASVFKQSTHGHILFFFFFFLSASPSILGAHGVFLNTYISSASLTQPAGSAPLSLLPVMIVNKSFTVVKGNKRVSERQITPTGRH